jgi:hypothetical protein
MDPSNPPVEYIAKTLAENLEHGQDLETYVADFRKLRENEIAYKPIRSVSQRGVRDLVSAESFNTFQPSINEKSRIIEEKRCDRSIATPHKRYEMLFAR